MLTTKKINDKIILVSAESQEILSNAFIRFQEHYESPEWKGKIFTEGQLRSWYSETYGANTYARDWAGFNIPSYVLDPFIKGLFNPLTEAEQELVDLFRYRTDKFYIIGAQDTDSSVLEHEICHGLYYTNDKYKKACLNAILANKEACDELYTWLSAHMYHADVHDDEVHAYVSADYEWLVNDLRMSIPMKLHNTLRGIKTKYTSES